jgi:hypothetical protein
VAVAECREEPKGGNGERGDQPIGKIGPLRLLQKSGFALALAGILGAGGCLGTQTETALGSASEEVPPAYGREKLIGRWGVASFHNDKDKVRTEREAKAQCSQPYSISKGSTDGVMMHVADDPKLYELKLKGSTDGKTYLGFEAPPGDPQDREVLSATDRLLVMRFVDPDANARYGTFVYVRCG